MTEGITKTDAIKLCIQKVKEQTEHGTIKGAEIELTTTKEAAQIDLLSFVTPKFSHEIKYGIENDPSIGKDDGFRIFHCPKLPTGEIAGNYDDVMRKLPCFKNFNGIRLTCAEPCFLVTNPLYQNIMKHNFLKLRMQTVNKYVQNQEDTSLF